MKNVTVENVEVEINNNLTLVNAVVKTRDAEGVEHLRRSFKFADLGIDDADVVCGGEEEARIASKIGSIVEDEQNEKWDADHQEAESE